MQVRGANSRRIWSRVGARGDAILCTQQHSKNITFPPWPTEDHALIASLLVMLEKYHAILALKNEKTRLIEYVVV